MTPCQFRAYSAGYSGLLYQVTELHLFSSSLVIQYAKGLWFQLAPTDLSKYHHDVVGYNLDACILMLQECLLVTIASDSPIGRKWTNIRQ